MRLVHKEYYEGTGMEICVDTNARYLGSVHGYVHEVIVNPIWGLPFVAMLSALCEAEVDRDGVRRPPGWRKALEALRGRVEDFDMRELEGL